MKVFTLENLQFLTKKDFNNKIKLIPTNVLEFILNNEMPLKDKSKVIEQISIFLDFINNQVLQSKTTVLTIDKNIFVSYFNRNTYTQFKDILVQTNILTNVTNENGVWYDKDNGIAKSYRVHNEYLTNNDYSLIILDKKKNKSVEVKSEVEVNERFLNTIITEELDYSEVFKNELEYHQTNNTTMYSLYSRILRALSLVDKRYIKTGNKVNRIYHSFSNLSKVTRKCFKTKYINIDIKNSQPTFLVYYLVSNNIKFEDTYKQEVENGTFYELFYDLHNNDRNLVKVAVYKDLFFAFNTSTETNKRFKSLFPNVWNELSKINDSKTSLASILQNLEADLFNSLEVKSSSKYYTLFDAIYFTNKKDIKSIENQIKKYGKKLNIKFATSLEEVKEKTEVKDDETNSNDKSATTTNTKSNSNTDISKENLDTQTETKTDIFFETRKYVIQNLKDIFCLKHTYIKHKDNQRRIDNITKEIIEFKINNKFTKKDFKEIVKSNFK